MMLTEENRNAAATQPLPWLAGDFVCSAVPAQACVATSPRRLCNAKPQVIKEHEVELRDNDRVSGVTTRGEVDVRDNAWIPRALARLAVVAALPDNWDDEGSPGTDPKILGAAVDLLRRIHLADSIAIPAPGVCPIPGGGFQLEWEYGLKSLDLEFIDDKTLCFLTARQTPQGDILASGEYPQRLLGETLKWLDWLTQ